MQSVHRLDAPARMRAEQVQMRAVRPQGHGVVGAHIANLVVHVKQKIRVQVTTLICHGTNSFWP